MSDDKRRQADALYQALTLGLMFPVAIAIGFFGGRWLDGVFGIRPWLTIILTACGAIAAFVNLFRAGATGDGE